MATCCLEGCVLSAGVSGVNWNWKSTMTNRGCCEHRFPLVIHAVSWLNFDWLSQLISFAVARRVVHSGGWHGIVYLIWLTTTQAAIEPPWVVGSSRLLATFVELLPPPVPGRHTRSCYCFIWSFAGIPISQSSGTQNCMKIRSLHSAVYSPTLFSIKLSNSTDTSSSDVCDLVRE